MTEITNNLIELPLDDFMKSPSLGLEVYLKLTDSTDTSQGRFVKLAHGVEDLDVDRVNDLKSRGIDRLYLNLENLDRYLSFERKILRAASLSTMLEPRKKFGLVRSSMNHLLRRMHFAEIGTVDFTLIQEALDATFSLLNAFPQGKELITCLEEIPNDLFNHTSITTLLALLIAKELKWTSPAILQKVALTGLLHDIGMKELPESARCTHPGHLSYRDRIVYNTHADKSAAEFGKIPGAANDVLLAIQQHHERLDGSGFPRGLRSGKIQPLAMLIAVADTFVEDLYATEDHGQTRVEDVIRVMAETECQRLPGDAILALAKIFHFDVGDENRSLLLRGGLDIG